MTSELIRKFLFGFLGLYSPLLGKFPKTAVEIVTLTQFSVEMGAIFEPAVFV